MKSLAGPVLWLAREVQVFELASRLRLRPRKCISLNNTTPNMTIWNPPKLPELN